MPSTNDFHSLDQDILEIFLEESRDLVESCEMQAGNLRNNPNSNSDRDGLKRNLHTIKGGARMAGLFSMGNLCHAIETFLGATERRTGTMTAEQTALLDSGINILRETIYQLDQQVVLVIPEMIIKKFESWCGDIPTQDQATPEFEAVMEPLQEDVVPNGTTQQYEDSANSEDGSSTQEDKPTRNTPQDQVRVPADLLDLLANRADEMAVHRAHLEQQVGSFRATIGELRHTHKRMREQLRRLEQETEAQIVARYQREREKGQAQFDPLELDQFSSLQQLSRSLAESSEDIAALNDTLESSAKQADLWIQQQARAGGELHAGLMKTRMLPLEKLAPRLERIVRQVSTDTHKRVKLILEGANGELDRHVLDRIIAPLEHMIRNSIAHGIELPDDRQRRGKEVEGTIRISLRQEGQEIVILVSDDGTGLDKHAIRRKAEKQGLIADGTTPSEQALYDMIFAPGFSTSDQVSQLSGRGVGMDVVRSEVRQLGGTIELVSTPGQGVLFTMRLPQKLAVVQAIIVRDGEETLAVPTASIIGIGKTKRDGRSYYRFAGINYPIHTLKTLAGQKDETTGKDAEILLVKSSDIVAGVLVDKVLETREVVVKSVGSQLSSIPGVYGATIDAGGGAIVILDLGPLVRHYHQKPEQVEIASAGTDGDAILTHPLKRAPLVMVVDDSITIRKVTARVLERHKFDVLTARDGIDALEQLEGCMPDVMLLDIEMPRMDGFELTEKMMAHPRYKHIPIIMITSRTGGKHRQRAMELGIQRYLGKPYQEQDLVTQIQEVIGLPIDVPQGDNHE